jgi:Penicillin binding protein transpeptidase domain
VIHRRHALGLLAAAALVPTRSFANVSYQRSEFRNDLAKRFFDLGTDGTFVGYKVDDYLIIASDKERSGEDKLPASTFKVPNSLIALETGVVADPDKDVFKWDGVTRSIEAWNKDHTLRSAIAASAVPVYQEIARRIGAERMQKYVDLLDYGNHNIGGGIDQFWLTGEMRIDPRRAAGVKAQPGAGARHPADGEGRRCDHSLQDRAVGCRARPALAGLAGRLGREGGAADRVRHEHGLQDTRTHRRAHDRDAAVPDGYRRDLNYAV